MNNNRRFISTVVIFLVLIEIASIFLMYKSSNNKETILEDVSLKNNNIISKNSVAIMLEQSDGTYKESASATWPTNMVFNASKSGCIDTNGATIENVLSYANNLVTVTTNKTSYCYVYFDLDKVAPTITTMSLNSGATYATSTTVTATLSWSDSDVAYYCVTNTNNSSSCSWKSASGTSASVSHTLSSGDGTKTVYGFIKDTTGNVSGVGSDTIVLDTAAPTSPSISIKGGASYTNSTSVALTLSASGATQMCISNTNSCTAWETYATSKTHTLTSGAGTKTVYVWYRDAAGNTTSVVSDTIILDTTSPTVGATANNNNSTSVTMTITTNEAGTYCVNTSSTASNMSSCTFSGSITTSGLTTSTFATDGTYYAHVMDSAGNYGISSPLSIVTCFTEETLVSYWDRKKKKKLKKKIKDIEAGDIVYSYDPNSGGFKTSKVKAVHINKANKLFRLTFEDGNYLEVSENHPFYVKDVGFMNSQILKAGYEILCADCESRKIVNVEEIFLDEYVDLYSLELENGGNFVVGLTGVITAAIYAETVHIKASFAAVVTGSGGPY